jgi:hypothetical protein
MPIASCLFLEATALDSPGVGKGKPAGGNIPAGASFPMRSSQSAGGAGISARTLGMILFANFAGFLADFAVKSS